ncbi:metallophosphoesterase, partial [Acetomicrobium sp. S15 = DSM 107314]|uniref:metallophosphoesterase n=1 Tax=Acetomicrobium sp. S15 = DSM 107314 TaxID=2529858 RepID=UPI0018E194FC
ANGALPTFTPGATLWATSKKRFTTGSSGEVSAGGRSLFIFTEALKPHTVWLAGDIVDESVYQAEEEKLAEEFSRLEAPYGVYAVTGNHE